MAIVMAGLGSDVLRRGIQIFVVSSWIVMIYLHMPRSPRVALVYRHGIGSWLCEYSARWSGVMKCDVEYKCMARRTK